jgi:hypothetical protein
VAAAVTDPRKNAIRYYVASLPSIDRGEHQNLTAVLDRSPWVAGFMPDEHALVRGLAQQRFAARDVAKAKGLRKARQPD